MKSTQPSNTQPSRWRAPAIRWVVGLVAVLIGLVLIVAISLPPSSGDPPFPATGKVLGAPNAPIVLEEYADFQCPFCGQFARGTLRQIEDKYVKNGTVKIVFRHFAKLGEESVRAAEAAECANEQDKFWAYYDTLYANQAGENQGAFSDQNLVKFAQDLGLDVTAFSTCLNSDRYRVPVQAATAEGRQRGVDHVPTLFVNNQKTVGAISLRQFETIISPLLSK